LRVIGVVDLRRSQAVHAIGGARQRYTPVRSIAGEAIDAGDPYALSRVYHESLGIRDLYVADLDALAGLPSQDDVIGRLAAFTLSAQSGFEERRMAMWLDAGVSSVEGAWHAYRLGASQVIVALETLSSWETLAAICGELGGGRVAFSLDLRNGTPMRPDAAAVMDEPVPTLALRARDAGAGAVVVIDVARVGTGAGLDLELLSQLRRAVPDLPLVAGGGVRGRDDLVRLASLGCDAALLATALHTGAINAADIAALGRSGRMA
jgi:phosphoribosylformimino-5-aminoimidazole carboxamide ribotide isomerase